MINIASSQPVHWHTAAPPTVAPVASVHAVAPAQRSQGDTQSSLGSERDARSAMAQEKRPNPGKNSAALQAAPLLPREPAQGNPGTPSGGDGAMAKEQAREAEEAKADSASKTLKLMEVLSTVWKASAAVVENALGIEPSADKDGVKGVGTSASRALAVPSKPRHQDLAAEVDRPEQDAQDPLVGRAAGDPVAYTEQGTSSWMPLETGQLLRKQA